MSFSALCKAGIDSIRLTARLEAAPFQHKTGLWVFPQPPRNPSRGVWLWITPTYGAELLVYRSKSRQDRASDRAIWLQCSLFIAYPPTTRSALASGSTPKEDDRCDLDAIIMRFQNVFAQPQKFVEGPSMHNTSGEFEAQLGRPSAQMELCYTRDFVISGCATSWTRTARCRRRAPSI